MQALRFCCRGTVFLAAVLLLVCRPTFGSDLSKFLHRLFDDHANRAPSGPELNVHANLHRTAGPLENYIVLLGSEDYFIRQAHRDPRVYVTRIYQTFLGRDPRPDELRFWIVQFQQGQVSRREVLRRFVRANRITQLPSLLPSRPVFRVPSTAPQIATELVNRTDLFINLVSTELGSSRFGRSLTQSARGLLAVAQSYRQVVGDPNTTGQQLKITLDNLERSLQELEGLFSRLPGVSPQSQAVLHEISELVTAARTAPGVSRPRPVQPPVENASISTLLESTRRFAYGLRSYQNLNPYYASLSRDVQGLAVQIESLSLAIRQGQRRPATRRAITAIVKQGDHISADIHQADRRLQRGWWQVEAQLTKTARSFGVSRTHLVDTHAPVLINQPAFGQLPYQPVPRPRSSRHREAVELADQLVAKIDGYLASLRPISARNRDVARAIGSLQNLRHETLAFRQISAEGRYGSQLTRSADQLMSQYQETGKFVGQMVAGDSTLNSPVFYQIGELAQKIRYAARGTSTRS